MEHWEEFLSNNDAIFGEVVDSHSNPTHRNLHMVPDMSPATLLNLIIHKTKKVYNRGTRTESNRAVEVIRKHTADMLQKINKLEKAQTVEARQEAKD